MTSPPPPNPPPLGWLGTAVGRAGMYWRRPQRQLRRPPAAPPSPPAAPATPPVRAPVMPLHAATSRPFWQSDRPVSPHWRMMSRIAQGALARAPPSDGSDDPIDSSACLMHAHTSWATQIGVRLVLACW